MNSSESTIVQAVGDGRFLPVHYFAKKGVLKRLILSQKPDFEGQVGEPIELTYQEALRYVHEYENHNPRLGIIGIIQYKWNGLTGYWDESMCLHGNTPKFCEVCHPELETDEDFESRNK